MDDVLHVAAVPKSTPPGLMSGLREAAAAWHDLLGSRLVSMVLFGSVARATARESSDIDIIVVAEDLPRSLTDRARPLRQRWEDVRAQKGLDAVEWNLIIKTPQEAAHHSPLYLDVVDDGIILYDRGGFFAAVLEAMRDRMRALGSRRVFLPDGTWYWDLKPDYRFGEVVEI